MRRSSWTGFFLATLLLSLSLGSRAQQFYATSETTGQLERIDLANQTITTVYTAAGKPDSILVNARGQLIYDLSPQGILALYDPATQTNTVLLSSLKGPRDLLFEVPTACNPNANANTMLVGEYTSGQIIRYDFTAGTFANLGPQLGSAATGFSVDGTGKVMTGDLTMQGDRAYFTVLKPGLIALNVYANATTTPTPLRSLNFAKEPRIPAIGNVRDGHVAVAATDTRVAVTWTTAQQLLSGDPPGGYAVFACTP